MRHLKIGAHKVKLKLPHIFPEGASMAQVDLDGKVIMISHQDSAGDVRPPTVILVSLIHEILHLLDYQGGLKLFGDVHDPDSGEGNIDPLAEALAQVLVDNHMINPNFMEMLKRQSEKE